MISRLPRVSGGEPGWRAQRKEEREIDQHGIVRAHANGIRMARPFNRIASKSKTQPLETPRSPSHQNDFAGAGAGIPAEA